MRRTRIEQLAALDHDCWWLGWLCPRLWRDRDDATATTYHRAELRAHTERLHGIAIGMGDDCLQRESHELCLSAIRDHPIVLAEMVDEYRRRWVMPRPT